MSTLQTALQSDNGSPRAEWPIDLPEVRALEPDAETLAPVRTRQLVQDDVDAPAVHVTDELLKVIYSTRRLGICKNTRAVFDFTCRRSNLPERMELTVCQHLSDGFAVEFISLQPVDRPPIRRRHCAEPGTFNRHDPDSPNGRPLTNADTF